MMKPNTEAERFLYVNESKTYNEFKTEFMANFAHSYTISEVIEKLKRTTFSVAKITVMGYILQMQELASRAKVMSRQQLLM